ncbi:MAG TPA: NUDIX domain-containing protein [Candidatus Saccharimonadales bacterium]|nr:NUDIX domain-containing protein [Candidatus Saccharimonadales bacterium]
MSTPTTPAPDHIDLRRGIDHIGVTVAAIVHDGHGRILLQKRGPKARDEQGNWDITGGALEFGESIEDAVRREVSEELCVEAFDVKFLTAYEVHRVQ